MKVVLLTGATGFIGTQIARRLLANSEIAVVALVRASDEVAARRKLEREWWDWPELVAAINGRFEVVCGDVCKDNLGLTQQTYDKLAGKVTHIIHTAADWRLVSLEELRKTNVSGTANILKFAKQANADHGLERFSHVSTAYVAGGRTGDVAEADLTDRFGFFTDYEKSKFDGELLVREAGKELPVSVFRPSMVVGDSKTGEVKTFNTFYFPLRLYLTGKLRVMPVSRALKINIVPVDYVADSISELTFDPQASGLTFHLVAPYESLPRLGEMMAFVEEWAKTNLQVKLPSLLTLPMSVASMKRFIKLQSAFQPSSRKTADALTALAPYFSENRKFQRNNIDKLLGTYSFDWRQVTPHLLEYAVYHSFLHRSDRTVHEQVLYRLESKSLPITYYDISRGKVTKKTAGEMRKEIVAAANALRSMGVRIGDRVAITGFNCSNYIAADVAIGLVGAVSVPIYYTAPPADVDNILAASESKLFFVGMPSMLSKVSELQASTPIVALCQSQPNQKVTTWSDFLAKSNGDISSVFAPVGFGDIATLRYSSGTTGKPKGAIFKHESLRYMAESIISITPWKARATSSRYLSFLPMGHVVEGILAAYSPYYYPAPVSMYFLEDFHDLPRAIPQVKPSLFFAVPRIYEKIWAGLESNWLGRFYISRKKGPVKDLLGRIVKRAMLRRAGLDKCYQLIAGSASCNIELLEHFHELGIEVYNAYGMTEAPLVTINRIGKNRLGTVGETMPQTQVQVSEEGEIMIKGPQVTAGYLDKTLDSPFKDGWLMSGDIGNLTKDGSLVILGRKKELIKTSYGKCIYSGKIEELIKETPHVGEALIVGESKPYCGALLWLPKDHCNQQTYAQVDKAIEQMNEQLSNPEKIKRWALMPNCLSIENGDLTPSLKLKRFVVAQKYQKTIDALYDGVAPVGDVHFGGVEKAE